MGSPAWGDSKAVMQRPVKAPIVGSNPALPANIAL